jgi:hypothetical protein
MPDNKEIDRYGLLAELLNPTNRQILEGKLSMTALARSLYANSDEGKAEMSDAETTSNTGDDNSKA